MAEKQNHKERLNEITDSIETGIMELFESDKVKDGEALTWLLVIKKVIGKQVF